MLNDCIEDGSRHSFIFGGLDNKDRRCFFCGAREPMTDKEKERLRRSILCRITAGELEYLRSETRKKNDEVEALQKKLEESRKNEMSLLDLLSRIRFALGDNGRRMQDELVDFCRELAEKSVRFGASE